MITWRAVFFLFCCVMDLGGFTNYIVILRMVVSSEIVLGNMSNKRANPFVEDFVQQRKIHVGLKQFNNNEDRLQKVYEKTLDLLFKGAKKCSVQNLYLANVSPCKKDHMKQLSIAKDGSLMQSTVEVPVKCVEQCSCGESAEVCCGYCEVWLCAACQHTCCSCLLPHCQRCSLSGSEGADQCVSCYS